MLVPLPLCCCFLEKLAGERAGATARCRGGGMRGSVGQRSRRAARGGGCSAQQRAGGGGGGGSLLKRVVVLARVRWRLLARHDLLMWRGWRKPVAPTTRAAAPRPRRHSCKESTDAWGAASCVSPSPAWHHRRGTGFAQSPARWQRPNTNRCSSPCVAVLQAWTAPRPTSRPLAGSPPARSTAPCPPPSPASCSSQASVAAGQLLMGSRVPAGQACRSSFQGRQHGVHVPVWRPHGLHAPVALRVGRRSRCGTHAHVLTFGRRSNHPGLRALSNPQAASLRRRPPPTWRP